MHVCMYVDIYVSVCTYVSIICYGTLSIAATLVYSHVAGQCVFPNVDSLVSMYFS